MSSKIKKWENFLKIIENKEECPAVLFEYKISKAITQQLVWRSGEHLFCDDVNAFSVMADALVLSAMDYGVFEFASDTDFNKLINMTPSGFKFIAAQKLTISDYLTNGEELDTAFEKIEANYLNFAQKSDVIAVSVNENLDEVIYKDEIIRFYSNLAEKINSLGKKCIWAEMGKNPINTSKVIDMGFDALYLNEYHNIPTSTLINEYNKDIALFGDTQINIVKTLKPNDVIEYITGLTKITNNKGYAYGTGNVWGAEFPYLNYISVLTTYLRL